MLMSAFSRDPHHRWSGVYNVPCNLKEADETKGGYC